MKRGITFALLLALVILSLLAYAYVANRKGSKKPANLSDAMSVAIAVVGLGGALRIFYIVFVEQPEPLGNEDLVCLFLGAIAISWCSVSAACKPFKEATQPD